MEVAGDLSLHVPRLLTRVCLSVIVRRCCLGFGSRAAAADRTPRDKDDGLELNRPLSSCFEPSICVRYAVRR